MSTNSLPIAIIGAGPIGLAAAAHLVSRGETPIVFEVGPEIAHSVRQWGHVRMFSNWDMNIDRAAKNLLESHGWQAPDLKSLPTGDQLADHYLLPLAEILSTYTHLNTRVLAVSRSRIDKMKDRGRGEAPFILQIEGPNGEEIIVAKAVIDASGTWKNPNPAGADGLFAPGELASRENIFYGIPDVLGKHRSRYAGKHTTVIGGGHSAINALLELGDLQQVDPKTRITWILRKGSVTDAYGGVENDALPGRGRLGVRIKEMVDAGHLRVRTPFYVTRFTHDDGQLIIEGDTATGVASIQIDEVISATGARPDLEMLREIRLSIDPSTESPTALAPLIDPNIHSCGTVPPHGERELRHPEEGFYVVGMKSYGRAPTFLLATGYEQVRSVVASLVGDKEAAEDVRLCLPETGVCSLNLVEKALR